MSTRLFECELTSERSQMGDIFSLAWCLRACARILVSPSGIIIIDEMTLPDNGDFIERLRSPRETRKKTQKTRMRYARSSQQLLTRTTAPVGASATSMNINYSDRDEMPHTPAPFPAQLVALLLDHCRLRQSLQVCTQCLCLRLKVVRPINIFNIRINEWIMNMNTSMNIIFFVFIKLK